MGLAVLAIVAGSLLRAEPLTDDPQIIRKAMDLLVRGSDTPEKFHYLRRREVVEFDSEGKVKSRESLTTRHESLEGFSITRVIARNDKALSDEERRRDEESIQARIVELRAKPPAKAGPRHPGEDAAFMREFANALEYRRIATETIEGRSAFVYDFGPKPGYKPSSMKFKVFEKMKGRMWIDRTTQQVIRGEAEMFDDVNVGFGLLGKIGKGTTFTMVRREAAPGLWVPVMQRVRFQARIMMVKNFRKEIDLKWSEYAPRPDTTQRASVNE